METSVVSKIGTPRISTGTSHAAGKCDPSGRIFRPSVAIRNPRNIAPPSPMKIFAGLKFQRRKSERGAQRGGAQRADQRLPVEAGGEREKTRGHGGDAGAQAVHVVENAERSGDAHDPDDGEAAVENDARAAGDKFRKKLGADSGGEQEQRGNGHADEKLHLVVQQAAIVEQAD